MGNITKDLAWKEEIPQEFTSAQMANIKANMSTSVPNVNIKSLEIYDEDEHIVGWWRKTIDGVKKQKPVYGKTIDLTSTVTVKDGSRILVEHNISNISNAVDVSGYAFNSSVGTIPIPQNFHNNDESGNALEFTVRISSGKIVYAIKTSLSIDSLSITIRYTKTTDEWQTVE